MKISKIILLVSAAAMAVACTSTPCQLKIMSYDINNYIGMDSLSDPQRTADIILSENPDVVALQKSGEADAVTSLATLTSMIPSVNEAGGIAILSVEKPVGTRYVQLAGEGGFGMLVADFRKFAFASVWMSPNSADQKASVTIIKEEAAKAGKPFILGGNLSAGITSSVIMGMMDDFTILTDISAHTFPADNPAMIVDYIMVYNRGIKDFSTNGQTTLDEPVASTHRPVVAMVEFK
jgi:endonuclease/exonuclease/phosphatase family metal-dependent hydrolase